MIDHWDAIAARIDDDEQLIAISGVGLYSSTSRLPDYQSGTVSLTHTHLYYVNDINPKTHSLSLPLNRVQESNYWAGFINSSAKVILVLSEEKEKPQQQNSYWTCQICDTHNPPAPTCALCGSPAPPSASAHATNDGSADEVACPVCTFLNRSGAERCEICNSVLPLVVSELRLSFRKGGASQFYTLLKRAVLNKTWSRRTPVSRSGTPSAGINSLLTSISTTSNNTSSTISSALSDLSSLQFSANEMLQMARQFNSRLSSNSGSSTPNPNEPEESTLIRISLAALPAPSSSAAEVESDERYLTQLATILQGTPGSRGGLISDQRPLLPLPELWSSWMRYRGVSLLPPSVLPPILPLLPYYTNPPLRTRDLGGSTVVFIPDYSAEGFGQRIVDLLKAHENGADQGAPIDGVAANEGPPVRYGMTTYEIYTALSLALSASSSSATAGVPIPIPTLAALILESEGNGYILRDDPLSTPPTAAKVEKKAPVSVPQPGPGVQWCRNIILEYQWDGEP